MGNLQLIDSLAKTSDTFYAINDLLYLRHIYELFLPHTHISSPRFIFVIVYFVNFTFVLACSSIFRFPLPGFVVV